MRLSAATAIRGPVVTEADSSIQVRAESADRSGTALSSGRSQRAGYRLLAGSRGTKDRAPNMGRPFRGIYRVEFPSDGRTRRISDRQPRDMRETGPWWPWRPLHTPSRSWPAMKITEPDLGDPELTLVAVHPGVTGRTSQGGDPVAVAGLSGPRGDRTAHRVRTRGSVRPQSEVNDRMLVARCDCPRNRRCRHRLCDGPDIRKRTPRWVATDQAAQSDYGSAVSRDGGVLESDRLPTLPAGARLTR